MTKKKTKTSKPAGIPFEDALAQLNEVVAQLEDGNLTLSESLEQYEQGVKNLKHCYQALEQAQRKIEQLVRLDESGNVIAEPFDGSATEQLARGTVDVDEDDDESGADLGSLF